jgi:hypothetical protein
MKVDFAIKFVLFGVKFHLVSSFFMDNGFVVNLILPYWEEALNSINGLVTHLVPSPHSPTLAEAE